MSSKTSCTWVDTHQGLTETLGTPGEPVVALFYASWCPFCVRFLPAFERQAERGGRRFVVVQDDREAIADHYSVTLYPTVLCFEKGGVSKRLDGEQGVGLKEEQLTEFLASLP